MDVWTESTIAFATGLLVTTLLLVGWLSLARRRGWTVRDRYKPGAPEVAGLGGVPVIVGWLAGVALIILFQRFSHGDTTFSWGPSTREMVLAFTALACAAMGLVDDLRKLSQLVKALLPFLLALPLALYLSDVSDFWPAYALDWPVFFVLVAVLLYVSLGTNLTNMHAGFNGLSTGNAFIILLAVALVAQSHSWSCVHITGWPGNAGAPPYCKLDARPLLLTMAGATAALLLFNRYPARIIEGNVASHLWGGAIAAALLLEGLWLEGLVLFAPQLVDFGLWGYARLRRYPFQKYAPLVDGRIRPDDHFKLKFLVARWFPREWQAVLVLWGLQALAAAAFVALVMA